MEAVCHTPRCPAKIVLSRLTIFSHPTDSTIGFSTYFVDGLLPPPAGNMSAVWVTLQEMLEQYIIPKRGQLREGVPHQPGGTSNTTTRVNMNLVAACIRAADSDHTEDPGIIFQLSTEPLDSLASILTNALIPQSPIPTLFSLGIDGDRFAIETDDPLNEEDHYPLFKRVFGVGLRRLVVSPAIFPNQQLPPSTEWVRETLRSVGKGDFEVTRQTEFGDYQRAGIVCEYKRELVLALIHLISFFRAIMAPQGLRLSLDSTGQPTLSEPLGQHVLSWCCQVNLFRCISDSGSGSSLHEQVVLEMDANRAHTNVLCSWDHFVLFHRAQSANILASKIVCRDIHSPSVRTSAGELITVVTPDWTPLKLMFALLLSAVTPEILGGFIQTNLGHVRNKTIGTPSGNSKTRKRKDGEQVSEGPGSTHPPAGEGFSGAAMTGELTMSQGMLEGLQTSYAVRGVIVSQSH